MTVTVRRLVTLQPRKLLKIEEYGMFGTRNEKVVDMMTPRTDGTVKPDSDNPQPHNGAQIAETLPPIFLGEHGEL